MTHDTLGMSGEHEGLVGYLYDELEPDQRVRFESHLADCEECRTAVEAMRGVRAQLAAWTLPASAGIGAGAAAAADLAAHAAGRWNRSRPWWAPGAFAAAAVILLAAAAAIANLEITYGREGVSVRTGWSRGAPQATAAAAAPSTPERAAAQARAVSAEDLVALERRLRTEFQAVAVSQSAAARLASEKGTHAPAASTGELLQRVQELIEQSETRQRRELAFRVAQVIRDFDTQRQTDLVRIQQGLAQIEGTTAADRQLLNYVVRASQRQDRN